MSSVAPVGGISKFLSFFSPPRSLSTLQKRCLFMLAFSSTGIAFIIWYYRRKKHHQGKTHHSKSSSRAKSAGTTAQNSSAKKGFFVRPVKQVDPRVPVTSGKQTGTSVRSLTEDEKRALRRRGGRSSRASSFDRASFSSIRSAKVSVEESMQPLGELNLDHYNEVLNTFQTELEKAINQSTKKTSPFAAAPNKRTTLPTYQPSVSFGNANVQQNGSLAVPGTSNSSSDTGSTSVSQSQQISSSHPVVQPVFSTALHPGSTPVNSQELIQKLQKLLDLASELQQKELDKESQESNTLVAESAILEDPLEEDLIEETSPLNLKSYCKNSGDRDDVIDSEDDDSSTLSFCSVSEFPTSPFAEDEFRSPGSHPSAHNYSTPGSNPVLNKFSFSSGGERLSVFGRKVAGGSGYTSPKTSSTNEVNNHTHQHLNENGVTRSARANSYHDATRSSVYSSGGEISSGQPPSSSYYTAASYNSAATISSPVSDPFLSAIGSPVTGGVYPLAYTSAASPAVVQMFLYEQGLNAVSEDAVPYRVLRTELLNLGSDSEFLAKLFGIRKALSVILDNVSNKDFLKEAGKSLVSDFLLCCNQTPSDFQTAFDEIVRFCADDDNWPLIEDELGNRGVVEMNFFDIVIDFIFLDAFDDLENPPSSIVNVLQNRWLSQSFKETALKTAVWSVLKAKRSRLRYPDGFINRFYSISEVMSPLFAYGFLGPPGDLQDLCLFFKGEVLDFVRKMFDSNHCRFSNETELAEDILALTRSKIANVTQRLNEVQTYAQ